MSFGQKKVETPLRSLFKEVVFTLADDSLKGRYTGSLEERKSLNYIEYKMKGLSSKIKFERQAFDIKLKDTSLISYNGYVFLNNHSSKTILISSHYDHIGLGGALSTKFITNQIHNGADDNASGVAMNIGLASELINLKKPNVNYLFVFYSGHEIGLYGSEAFGNFIKKNTDHFKNISCVINFDMVGRLDSDIKILKCMNSKSAEIILNNVQIEDFDLNLNLGKEEQLKNLDTKFFYNQGVPCLNFTTGNHLDYHTPTDDAIYINFDGMDKINKYLLEIIDCYNVGMLKNPKG
jgi:aminopeptidase-like protein